MEQLLMVMRGLIKGSSLQLSCILLLSIFTIHCLASNGLASNGLASNASASNNGPAWQDWSPKVYKQAQSKGKLVLLDLSADWCSTCKKMEQTTYRDSAVIDIISKHYIPVQADPEAHADLAKQYLSYGVPALIIMDAAGNEIFKQRGYLSAQHMSWTLQAVAENPDPSVHR